MCGGLYLTARCARQRKTESFWSSLAGWQMEEPLAGANSPPVMLRRLPVNQAFCSKCPQAPTK